MIKGVKFLDFRIKQDESLRGMAWQLACGSILIIVENDKIFATVCGFV